LELRLLLQALHLLVVLMYLEDWCQLRQVPLLLVVLVALD